MSWQLWKMIDLLLTPLPDVWEGRRIDPDFRPMVWLSNQYLRKAQETDPEALIREAFRRFYRDPVRVSDAQAAFEGLMRFYVSGTPEHEAGSSSSSPGEIAFDYAFDSGYIVAAFQQAYHIDLTTEKIHWFRFRALFQALPEDTTMTRIMHIRSADLTEMDGKTRKQYEDLKEAFALPTALKGGKRIVTVEDHDAAFLARFRRP